MSQLLKILCVSSIALMSFNLRADQTCMNAIYEFVNSSSDVFHRLRPDDWVKINFENGEEFIGKFKYIKEDTVIFLGSDYVGREYKTEHILRAKIELIYREQ